MLETPHDAAEAVDFHSPEPFSVDLLEGKLTFVADGQDRLAAVLDLIVGAKTSLQLYYYAFAKDSVGEQVRDALAEAAGRGVKVTLIVDDFAALADDHFLALLTNAGGIVLRFHARWNVRYLIRNHQKMLISDGQTVLVGGFNIEEAYFASPQDNGWNDLGLIIEGRGVELFSDWFEQLEAWSRNPRAQFRSMCRMVREWDPGEGRLRLLVGGPTRGLSSWARSVVHDIQTGSKLDMMEAYFSPRGGLVKCIAGLARRGRALILLPSKTDNPATIPASRSLYGRLLKAGVRIAEFRPCKVHTKLIVVDDAVYVGSANFDMRSLYLNLELMVRIEDAAIAERMRAFIQHHVEHANEITLEEYRKRRGLLTRLRWALAWFLVVVLDYRVTRRLNLAP